MLPCHGFLQKVLVVWRVCRLAEEGSKPQSTKILRGDMILEGAKYVIEPVQV
jgi:hypothetical protein